LRRVWLAKEEAHSSYGAEPPESLFELPVWGRESDAATAPTEGRPVNPPPQLRWFLIFTPQLQSDSQTYDERSKRRMLAYLILGKLIPLKMTCSNSRTRVISPTEC
jgi:hypothetical protein